MTKKDITWMKNYNILKSIFDKNGHCHVQKSKCSSSFYNWICKQRMDKKDGVLRKDRELLLTNINFGFNESWEEMFELFLEYYAIYKNFCIPKDNEFYPKLGNWLTKQIKLFKTNRLPSDKASKYRELGLNISSIKSLDESWQESFLELKKLFIQNNNCNVPNTKEFKSLYRFAQTQRYNFKHNKLSDRRIKLLKEINFCFDARLSNWLNSYEKAKGYYIKYRNLNISPSDSKYKDIYAWLASNKQKFRNGKLSEFQIEKLEELEFVFISEAIPKQWLDKFYKAEKFYFKNGHCSIDPIESSKSLYKWALEQCDNYTRGALSKKQLAYLNRIEFDFGIKPLNKDEKTWFNYYFKAKEFFIKNGHCFITKYDCSQSMYKWTQEQIFAKNHGLLDKKHEEYLNRICFEFNDSWDNMFRRYSYYYKLYNSTSIPKEFHLQYHSIDSWIKEEVKLFKQNKLPQSTINSFSELGIDLSQLSNNTKTGYNI